MNSGTAPAAMKTAATTTSLSDRSAARIMVAEMIRGAAAAKSRKCLALFHAAHTHRTQMYAMVRASGKSSAIIISQIIAPRQVRVNTLCAPPIQEAA